MLKILGDKVSRRGPMTGGYIDVKKSKLELSRKLKELKNEHKRLAVSTLFNIIE